MHTYFRRILGGLAAGVMLATLPLLAGAAQAQTKKQPKAQTAVEQTVSDEKPNILFIIGDDIGFMQPRIYHRGLMVGNAKHRPHRAGGGDLHGLCRHAELHLRPQSLLHGHVSAAHGPDPTATAGQPVLFAARHHNT
jgi:hypothetical protein